MFHGSVSPEARSIVAEHARSWPLGTHVHVAGSGNLILERTLDSLERRFEIYSNDINPDSAALGFMYAKQRLPFAIRPTSRDDLGWLEDDGWLDGGAGTLATLMLGSNWLPYVGHPGVYQRRMVQAYRDQYPKVWAAQVAKLNAISLDLAGFTAEYTPDYVSQLPAENAVVAFLPLWGAADTPVVKAIDTHFDWPAPTLPEPDPEDTEEGVEDEVDEDVEAALEVIVDRPHWLVALDREDTRLAEFQTGYVKKSDGAPPLWIYGRPAATRYVGPRQKIEPVLMPRLGVDEDLGDTLTLHPLTGAQFNSLRAAYLNRNITTRAPLFACAVAAGDKLIGAFGYLQEKFAFQAYLMSDFPVRPTKYGRLSKLIVLAATSAEAQILVERSMSRRVTGWMTTAFSNRPTAAKYARGVPGVKLVARNPADDGIHAYCLNYKGPLGEWTLAEALQMWRDKHSQVVTSS